MTTIATDGKTIAADGLRTFGGEICGTAHKKIRVSDGCIFTFSGPTPLFEPAVKWQVNGADPRAVPESKGEDNWWSILVLENDGCGGLTMTRYSSLTPYPERFDPPFTMGAGAEFALGAMAHGASPEEAVRLTAKHFNHTGGEIQVINIAEALGVAKPNGADEKLYGYRPPQQYRVEWRAYLEQ